MESKIIKHLVTTYVNKKFRNPEKQRKFLIDCIESNGYIVEKNLEEQTDETEDFDDLYQHFMPSQSSQQESNSFPDFKQSIQEQSQTSVDPYGFNRTFINANSVTADKLNVLQKRGITYEETQFNQVKEQMEQLINRSLKNQDLFDKILQTALNIYLNIMIYYKDNPFGFTENKGSLKNGYIFLCVYYSFIYNGVSIKIEKLMESSEKTRLKDLPTAQKNIKMIFNNVNGYSFINKITVFTNYSILFKKTLNISNQELIAKIENVIEETKELIASSNLKLYSVIYFVCNDYYPFKVKVIFNETETRITYDLLNKVIEPFSSSTVRKITDQLRTLRI